MRANVKAILTAPMRDEAPRPASASPAWASVSEPIFLVWWTKRMAAFVALPDLQMNDHFWLMELLSNMALKIRSSCERVFPLFIVPNYKIKH